MLLYFIQTWTEWKSDIKRKLAHNKVESRATEKFGGQFSMPLTSSIVQSVEGVAGIAIGLFENVGVESEEEIRPNVHSLHKS